VWLLPVTFGCVLGERTKKIRPHVLILRALRKMLWTFTINYMYWLSSMWNMRRHLGGVDCSLFLLLYLPQLSLSPTIFYSDFLSICGRQVSPAICLFAALFSCLFLALTLVVQRIDRS
jgi:hypothetical protein